MNLGKDIEKSFIDILYKNVYYIKESSSESDDSESNWIFYLQFALISKIYKYTMFCIKLSDEVKRTISPSIQVYLSRKNKLVHLKTVLMLVICLLQYLRLQIKFLILSTIRKLVRSYAPQSFIWTIMKLKNSNFIKKKTISGTTCFLIDIINELLLLHY